jgi:arsenate reductase
MKKILVLCTGNSCRSQMAEGYLRFFAGGRAEIYSAGIEQHGLNERAVRIMAEDGIDISKHSSKLLDTFEGMLFDEVITVCDHAKESCPFFPAGTRTFHHDFKDPSRLRGSEEEVMAAFRETRNAIREYCREFIAKNL